MSDKKIEDKPKKSNNSIEIKTATISDVIQNANIFPSV